MALGCGAQANKNLQSYQFKRMLVHLLLVLVPSTPGNVDASTERILGLLLHNAANISSTALWVGYLLLVTFICYIVISRSTGVGMKTTT